MELDDKILEHIKSLGYTEGQYEQAMKEMVEDGWFRKDGNGYTETPTGAKIAEKDIAKKWGEFKKIMDMESGKWHKVPTCIIFREGIRQEDLKHFPEWTE